MNRCSRLSLLIAARNRILRTNSALGVQIMGQASSGQFAEMAAGQVPLRRVEQRRGERHRADLPGKLAVRVKQTVAQFRALCRQIATDRIGTFGLIDEQKYDVRPLPLHSLQYRHFSCTAGTVWPTG